VVEVRAMYLTFEDERETMLYFLVFHDVREASRKIQNLVVDQRLSEHEAQSELMKYLS